MSLSRAVYLLATPRNQIQETTISGQFVLGMRFLEFDFAVHAMYSTDIAKGAACLRVLKARYDIDVGYATAAPPVLSQRYGLCCQVEH
eukprot:739092-Rhodomonas_salina.5